MKLQPIEDKLFHFNALLLETDLRSVVFCIQMQYMLRIQD